MARENDFRNNYRDRRDRNDDRHDDRNKHGGSGGGYDRRNNHDSSKGRIDIEIRTGDWNRAPVFAEYGFGEDKGAKQEWR